MCIFSTSCFNKKIKKYNTNFEGHYSWNFTRISLNRKEIQRVVLIPLMQKFLLRHIYKKTRKKKPLNAISDAQFCFKQLK
jgi:hypothetical protein